MLRFIFTDNQSRNHHFGAETEEEAKTYIENNFGYVPASEDGNPADYGILHIQYPDGDFDNKCYVLKGE